MDNAAQTGVPQAMRQRLRADERRQQIVECAFAMIAEAGLESFRTRDVADRAGINSATLHHYFATKEALIEGVASHLANLYRELRSPAKPARAAPRALQALRREFADAQYLRKEHSDMLAVSAEFMLQARRDRTAAQAISALHQHWRGQVEAIIRDGQTAGVFRAGIDPTAGSMVVVGALWSATGLLHTSDQEFNRVCVELESWLVGADPSGRERKAR
jgi:AcrR family transcriptional regulator